MLKPCWRLGVCKLKPCWRLAGQFSSLSPYKHRKFAFEWGNSFLVMGIVFNMRVGVNLFCKITAQGRAILNSNLNLLIQNTRKAPAGRFQLKFVCSFRYSLISKCLSVLEISRAIWRWCPRSNDFMVSLSGLVSSSCDGTSRDLYVSPWRSPHKLGLNSIMC